MGEADGQFSYAKTSRTLLGTAMQEYQWLATPIWKDFDLSPTYSAYPGPQGLHCGLFPRKAHCQLGDTATVQGQLRIGEYATEEAVATTADRRFDSMDLHDVDSGSKQESSWLSVLAR